VADAQSREKKRRFGRLRAIPGDAYISMTWLLLGITPGGPGWFNHIVCPAVAVMHAWCWGSESHRRMLAKARR
jgi:hypothetical protein